MIKGREIIVVATGMAIMALAGCSSDSSGSAEKAMTPKESQQMQAQQAEHYKNLSPKEAPRQ